ncbi:U3 small nucleolar RNA-associated protein 21 [Spathaspora sp. JA1]|nr:U3 small nucleolar RNA-associated protein 21 [Spathaspora sp. JA1]
MDKRRKTTEVKTPVRPSKIFSPFRVLGNVTDATPFAIGTLGSTFYGVTSIGKSFQIYDLATLHLLFVSQTQTSSNITCLAAHYHYVYVGYGNKIGIYKRGKLEHTLVCESSGVVSQLCVFGEYLIAANTEGEISVFRKVGGLKYHSELYTTLRLINPVLDGDIVGLIHPPTYLNKIVVATTNGIFIINVRSGKLLFKYDQFDQESLSSIEYAPVLDIIAVGTSTGSIYLFNLRRGKILRKISTALSSKITSLSFRTDGSPHLVAGLNSGDLFFYDLNKKSRIHILRNAHSETHGGVANAKFLNGQPIILTNGGDNHLKEFVFDPNLTTNSSIVSPPRHLRSRGGHSAPPIAIEFPNEEKTHLVYSASRDRSFWCFSLRKDAQAQEMSQRLQKSNKRQPGQVNSLKEKFPEIMSIASSQAREGEWENILTVHKDESFARTWDSRSKRIGRHVLNSVDGGIVKSVCISQCGNFALVGSSQGGIAVYNLQSGLLRKKYMLHKVTVTGLSIDGMNRKFVSCGLDGVVGFYDFGKSKYLGKLQLESPITTMVYHKSSDLVACALDDLSIVVIDVTTQKVVRILYGHTNRISGLDFSPDGRWIVSVSLDSTLRTWDLPSGGCIDGVYLPVVATSVKFSPLGEFLATTHVSGNGINLWTNRAQFKPVSTRHVEEEDFSTMLLPNVSGDGGATLLEGALDEDTVEDENLQTYTSMDQIEDLVTLSSLGPNKFNTLIHLDVIKSRSKPIEPVKKPEKAPFFLQLSGEVVGDRAVVVEGGVPTTETEQQSEESSKLRSLNTNDHQFESKFTSLLRQAGEQQDFGEFLQFLVNLPPATTDLEIRSLNSIPPLTEMNHFIQALIVGIESNTQFDIYQALFTMFLKSHGDVIHNSNDSDLNEQLSKYSRAIEKNQSMDELVKYCSGVITSIVNDGGKLYVGVNNGDLLVFTKASQDQDKPEQVQEQDSGKRLRSFNDVKTLFADNDTSKMFSLSGNFKNVTRDGSSINSIHVLHITQLNKSIIGVCSDNGLTIFEIVGSHINQIFKLEESVSCLLNVDRILYIGVKQRLLIFQILNKSRNLFSIVKIKELTMKDRIKTIDVFEEQLLIGLTSDYCIVNQDTFEIIPVENTEEFTHSTSSFSLFGLTSNSPKLWTITQKDNVLLIRDTQVVNIKLDLTMNNSLVKFVSVPLAIINIAPIYLLVVYSKKLEIINIETGDLIQRFIHHINSNQIYVSVESACVSLCCNNDIIQFSVVPYERQLDQYLSSGELTGITQAISLVSKLSTEFFNTDKEKLMKLRQLYSVKSKLLFNEYNKYHESLVEIGSEWIISFHDILSLFPSFLNGETSLFPQEEKPQDLTIIQRIKVDDLRTDIESETDNDIETTTSNSKPKQSSHIRKFQKAVNNLIIYLTEQRRILAKFQDNSTITWKGITITPRDIYPTQHDPVKFNQLQEVATIIDTSLFLCYFHVKPMLLGPLLRLPSNHCDSNVVNQVLQGNKANINFIKELLDFYFGRDLHDDALKMLYDNNNSDLIVQYLQKLSGDNLSLIFKYCDLIEQSEERIRAVFMNDSYQCESYDYEQVLQYLIDKKFGIIYLEWILFHSDYDISGKLLIKFETKLASLYLTDLKLHDQYYDKLFNLLKNNSHYDPWEILKQIPTNQDKFLRLVIFIYKRLEEHEKSIDVLFNQLNDFENAMEYASDIYYTTSSQIGQSLFHKLVEDLLMNYIENLDKVSKLVTLHGSKMSIKKLLTQLPDTFPLYKLSQFLNMSFTKNHELLYNSKLKTQLYKVGTINMEDKLLNLTSEGYKINSSGQPCAVCNKRLGYAVFGVTKDNQVVHYGCIKRAANN